MAMNSAAAAGAPVVTVKKSSAEEKSGSPNPLPVFPPNLNPNPNPGTRASRWSDAPPSNDANSAPEPPQKRVKNDALSLPAAVANDAPPGLAYPQTAAGTIIASSLGGASEQAASGYNVTQQNSNLQSYGSHYQPLAPAHGSFAPGSAKGTGALFYKTKLCTKFKIGACSFNERCHFAHGVEDLRKPPPLWETMATGGSATPGTLGGSFTRPKTRPCRYFAEGNCPYNERCNFLHGNEDPQRMQGPTYGASGPYTTYSMQQAVVVPAQPQGYSGVPAYPNSSSVSNSMQYPNPNQGYATPSQYSNPSTIPSTLPSSSGLQTDYPSGSVVPNTTPYGTAPAPSSSVNPYPSAPEGTTGASANFNSWNGSAVPAANPTPAYIQTSQQITNQGYQTASWMPQYAAGAYPKVENLTANPQYSQQQAQQTHVVSSAPYVQGVSQQSGSTMHADAGLYQNTYSGPGYPNQQADYTARYNMAEAWGGQTQ